MPCILPLLSILNKELISLKGIVNKDSEIKNPTTNIPRKMLHPRVIWTRIAVMNALQSWVEVERGGGGVGWVEERGRETIRQILAESLGDTRHLGAEYVCNMMVVGIKKC